MVCVNFMPTFVSYAPRLLRRILTKWRTDTTGENVTWFSVKLQIIEVTKKETIPAILLGYRTKMEIFMSTSSIDRPWLLLVLNKV